MLLYSIIFIQMISVRLSYLPPHDESRVCHSRNFFSKCVEESRWYGGARVGVEDVTSQQ